MVFIVTLLSLHLLSRHQVSSTSVRLYLIRSQMIEASHNVSHPSFSFSVCGLSIRLFYIIADLRRRSRNNDNREVARWCWSFECLNGSGRVSLPRDSKVAVHVSPRTRVGGEKETVESLRDARAVRSSISLSLSTRYVAACPCWWVSVCFSGGLRGGA